MPHVRKVSLLALVCVATFGGAVRGDDAAAVTVATTMTKQVATAWSGANPSSTVRDLHREYNNIFKFGNRNAASHLWTTFLLGRSEQMTHDKLLQMFSGYCAVSGSPVGPNDYNRYMLRLPVIGGEVGVKKAGFMHYCCWPCVCDTQDFFHVDTKTVRTKDGERKYSFVVLGNPCEHPEKLHEPFHQPFYGGRTTTIARDAQEVRCDAEGNLVGATLSDHGYIIYNMFFDIPESSGGEVAPPRGAPQPGRMSNVGGVQFQDEYEYAAQCADRAANGFNSGMGEIFRRVAYITKIQPTLHPQLPCVDSEEHNCSSLANNTAPEGQ